MATLHRPSRHHPAAQPRWRGAVAGLALLGLVGLTGLTGCASAPQRSGPSSEVLDDAMFPAAGSPVTGAELFALSPAMRSFLAARHELRTLAPDREQALLALLQREGDLRLEYDSESTRTAAEAFEARAGNCLSLVIMTAALAKEMGLRVHYQQVLVEQSWSRQGDVLTAAQHVNLRLGSVPRADRRVFLQHDLVIDFLPPQDVERRRVVELDEARVLAMFHNNRAAESLVLGQLDAAYAHVRTALRHDAGFAPAYNTLGLVYARRGADAWALRAQERALALDAGNPHTLSNLIATLRRQGQATRADELARQLARLEPVAPLSDYERGRQAMAAGDLQTARAAFERELARMPDLPELHHALAELSWRQGDAVQARAHLQQALDSSGTGAQRQRYLAKLERLRGLP